MKKDSLLDVEFGMFILGKKLAKALPAHLTLLKIRLNFLSKHSKIKMKSYFLKTFEK